MMAVKSRLIIRRLLLQLACTLLLHDNGKLLQLARGLSSSSSSSSSGTCKIVGVAGTGTQYLPRSYVENFERWQVQTSAGNDSVGLAKIDRRDVSVSNDNLWLRPSLDIMFRNGVPSYCMAGILLHSDDSNVVWSPFTAEQWTTFAVPAEPAFRILLFVGSGDGTDDVLWAQAQHASIQDALSQLATLLAGVAPEKSLSTGYQIVSFPLDMKIRQEQVDMDKESQSSWIEGLGWLSVSQIVRDGQDANANRGGTGVVTVMATGEIDAREVLTLDPALVEMTVTSLLQVPVKDLLQEETCNGVS